MNTEYININAEINSQENNARINVELLLNQEKNQYNPNLLSEQQVRAGKKILTNFIYNIRWQILLAQMQSGKTETFLFVAAEMIRRGMVEKVVIFSGNSEIDLKTQLNDIVQDVPQENKIGFYRKYNRYLRDNLGLEEDQRTDIIYNIKLNIIVKWGPELKNYVGPYENTLFIWEEAHYAQSKDQGPDKFLQKIGIHANGDKTLISKNRNYVVSISATPFSELCNYYKQKTDNTTTQDKRIVVMEPGNNYNSVEKMIKNERIKYYSSINEGLTEALNTQREKLGNKFAIVRINNTNEEEIKTIIKNNNWHYETVDSVGSKEQQKHGKTIWKSMKHSPNQDTVILIRQMCRMGQNLIKNHLLFCFETAKDCQTDTLLQSLLGRICGYSTNSENVNIYLSKQIEKGGELKKYIQMTHDLKNEEFEEFEEFEVFEVFEEFEIELNPTIPKKAKNLKKSGSGHKTNPIIIMKIKNEEHNNYNKYKNVDGLNKQEIKFAIQTDIQNAFNTDNVENNNTEKDTQDIKSVINNSETKWQFHYITGNEETFKNVPEKIENSIKFRTPFTRDGGCGFKSASKLQVNVWIIEIATGTLQQGDIYIDCFLKNEENKIPDTTKNEVFATNNQIEDNNLNRNWNKNYLDKEHDDKSYTNINILLRELIDIIKYTSSDCLHCIDVTEEVLESLQKNGTIFNNIKETFQKTLKITKPPGRIPRNVKDRGIVRLKSISW